MKHNIKHNKKFDLYRKISVDYSQFSLEDDYFPFVCDIVEHFYSLPPNQKLNFMNLLGTISEMVGPDFRGEIILACDRCCLDKGMFFKFRHGI